MDNNQTAYNFAYFEKKEQLNHNFKVSENKTKTKKFKLLNNIKIFFALLIITVLTISVLNTDALNNSLIIDKLVLNQQLENVLAKNDYLENEISSKLNLEEISTYAEQTLRLVKIDKSQIEYIYSEEENVISTKEQSILSFFDSLSSYFMNLVEVGTY